MSGLPERLAQEAWDHLRGDIEVRGLASPCVDRIAAAINAALDEAKKACCGLCREGDTARRDEHGLCHVSGHGALAWHVLCHAAAIEALKE